jgi:2-hydroxy-6-oxonona-2,4-dienedioate hydrolase
MRASAVDVARAPAPQLLRHTLLDGGLRIAERSWVPRSGHDRRPVVLVHGLVVSSRYHTPLARHLARHRPVHAPDLPGFGAQRSPRHRPWTRGSSGWRWPPGWMPAGSPTWRSIANSYGCQIATETALARPTSSADSYCSARPSTVTRDACPNSCAAGARSRRPSPGPAAHPVRDYLRAGAPRAIATFRHAMADRMEERLPLLDVPTLVCRGSRDPIVSQRWAAEVAELLPDGQLAVLPGATHAVNHEMPLQTARTIEYFLHQRT